MVTAPETPEAKLNRALELIGGSIDPEIAESYSSLEERILAQALENVEAADGAVPGGARDDLAEAGAEAGEEGGVALAAELAEVDHAGGGHVGGPGVADVGVVLPHHGLGLPAVPGAQAIEGVGHVTVPHVP